MLMLFRTIPFSKNVKIQLSLWIPQKDFDNIVLSNQKREVTSASYQRERRTKIVNKHVEGEKRKI